MNRISAITCAAMCLFFSCGAAAQEADNQKGVLSETVLLGEKEPETEQLLIQKETPSFISISDTKIPGTALAASLHILYLWLKAVIAFSVLFGE